ncbi:MAG: hypothetical protein KAI66_26665 [Lentisphaeria bacterium]|nr:hypothetical protein [Lentisphaeria bacterium]
MEPPQSQTQHEQEAEPEFAADLLWLVRYLLLALLLCTLCVGVPVLAAGLVSPWIGHPVALAGAWAWLRFGPPAMPGFLPGMLCLWGLGVCIGSLVACVIVLVEHLST